MLKKITIYCFFTLLTSNAQAPKQQTSPTKASQALEVITHIAPLQALILGYMGSAFEYVVDPALPAITKEFSRDSQSIIAQNYSRDAWLNFRRIFEARGIYPENVNSRAGNWCATLTRKRQERIPHIEISHTQKLIKTIKPTLLPNHEIMAIDISPGGDQLITVTGLSALEIVRQEALLTPLADHAVFDVWDLATEKVIYTQTLSRPRYENVGAKFSPDGNYIAFDQDNKIVIIDAKKFQYITDIPVPKAFIFDFSLDGNHIAYGYDGKITFYRKIMNNALITSEK